MLIKNDSKKIMEIFNDEIEKNKERCFKTGESVLTITSKFMKYIIDDIKVIEKFECSIENKRHIYAILRVTVEELIIYKFLMNSKKNRNELCNDFLGFNIDIDKLDKSGKSDFEKLKELRGKRTTLYSNIFKKMASEFENVDGDTSLYNLYSMMADYIHNAYYEHILEEYNKEVWDGEEIDMIILTILGSFLETYNKVIEN
ncbi:hypothetical protein [Clostridium sp.]|uniref:hypothetical protein n=1 Tax=Clostridium sp. TaxID=1506 RepID=UPI00257B2405|nr:hypothetical protein [Clostridium sp.]MBS4842571.1 hypothetical protein [Clostridium sp.]MDU1403566.1 hypothetical protein [Clostridium sp.]MDU4927423.1 hypothetical protein [Clostridium sp.]